MAYIKLTGEQVGDSGDEYTVSRPVGRVAAQSIDQRLQPCKFAFATHI